MEERKVLKEEMTRIGDTELSKEIKKVSRNIAKSIKRDEQKYFEQGLNDIEDVSKAWRTANELLGNKKNLAPTAVKVSDSKGHTEIIRNPKKLADLFNNFFKEKVQKLRLKTDLEPSIPPTERLMNWLNSREQPPPPFFLKEIDTRMLRMIIQGDH